jgi:hypothetical protein
MASENEGSNPNWLESVGRAVREKPALLITADVILLGLALFLGIRYQWEWVFEVVGLVFFALALTASVLWFRTRESGTLGDLDATRILVLVVGGVLGITIALIPIGHALRWLRDKDFSGKVETWQSLEAWQVPTAVVAELAGLGIMFASLSLARTQERTSPVLRRLLYGYNTVLTGLLLLAVLVVFNIMAYRYLPTDWDWTSSSLYTVSPRTRNILEGLDKPVKVYVFMTSREDRAFPDVQNLLTKCQEVTNKVQVEYLSRDRNPERMAELIRQYQMVEIEGLLVVYGSEPGERHQFIKALDLADISSSRRMEDTPRYVFKGEDALMTAIVALEEGKKSVVYFTQGNGELDINDTIPHRRPDMGAGLLRDRLQKANYEVKGLILSPVGAGKAEANNIVTAKEVPEDASVVVIAGPRETFAPETLAALRNYMKPADPKKPKGKMVVLLDVVPSRTDNRMFQTGLESFLNEFNVEVENSRIMVPSDRQPLSARVTANPQLRQINPVAAAFEGELLPLYNVRPVRPRSGVTPEGGSEFQANVLLMAMPLCWKEEDIRTDPYQLWNDYQKNRMQELRTKLAREPVPVAVAVSEASPDAMFNPHRPSRQSPEQKPRLLVIGDATFASNINMSEESSGMEYALVASCLAWLRERPDFIGIEPKKRDVYQLKTNTNVARMVVLPAALMVLGVVGLGLGVWVVRRR